MYKRKRQVKIPDDPSEAYGKALKTAYHIVGFKDNTVAEMRDKLSSRGYGEETVEAVIEHLSAKGYLDDERMLLRAVRQMAEGKLYGKARIRQELRRKSYDPSLLASLDFEREELCDIDFAAVCYRLLQKRGGVKDQKTYAFLVRYGHSTADIRAAYRRFAEETEEYKETEQ